MSLKALFDADPEPGDLEIERAVAGNLCRCGTYLNILAAAREVRGTAAVSRGAP
jgi:aerobic-type carbon monoxide dehydrogenase small subunit (CoxS/CutS family)